MTLASINKKIKALPPEKRKELELLIENLSGEPARHPMRKREYGFFKGKIKLAIDFDATPPGFQNYL